MTTTLDIRAGDHVVMTTAELGTRLWQVEQCAPRGFVMRPTSGGDAQTWGHDEIFKVFAAGGLTLYPAGSRNANPQIDALKSRAFDSLSPRRRRRAQRRLAYAKHAEQLLKAGRGLVDACKEAADRVYADNIEAWKLEERDAAIADRARAESKRRRKPLDLDAPVELPPDLEKPSWSSVRVWLKRWLDNGRDIRVLTPLEENRGNRKPRHGLPAERQIVFEYVICKHFFKKTKRPNRQAVYDEYEDECRKKGITRIESYSSFCKKIKKEVTEREEYAKRHGSRAALMKFGVFETRALPDFALEEVQVDHCLIDVFVLPPDGGPPVRPWLTAILDVATRAVLGIHIGFTPPSYDCLQRCIAHAIWPKDLSAFPEIENDWPFFGIFDFCFADNGLDFLCGSLRATEAALDFEVINLPIRSPWLKGVIERFFRTLNTRVFSLADGRVLQGQNKLEPYNPAHDATWTLDRLSYEIVKFICDDYHVTPHPRLGTTPLARWRELTALKAIRIPPSPDLIIPLTGLVYRKEIGSKGVHINGHTYLDRALFSEIRAERDAKGRLWDFRRDPFDLGVIHFLYKGVWRHVPSTTPQTAVGVTRFQHRMHVAMAKHLAGEGHAVTDQHLLDAQRVMAAQAQDIKNAATKSAPGRGLARYGDNGAYATGIVGLEQKSPTTDDPAAAQDPSRPTLFSPPDPTEAPRDDARLKQWMEEWENG